MEFIIITGLSGAGKSQTIRIMEDLEYYAIDNMPPKLIKEFVNLLKNSAGGIDKVAFVADIRGGEFFDDLIEGLEFLESEDIDYKIMFLEASNETLLRRYKETRRIHPLAKNGSVIEGIRSERKRLEKIKSKASFVIDTSNTKVASLNEELKRLLFAEKEDESFALTVQSFGYKYGMPIEADWVLDVRFISNPFYLSSMKNLTGNSKRVSEYVLAFPETKEFIATITDLVEKLISHYAHEGKYNLVLAIGCTGGRHRSVAIANEIGKIFKAENKHVVVIHRDL
jgi:UPF0042 nucleotide-binding protein